MAYFFSIGIHKEVQGGASPWMYFILLFPLSFVGIGIWGIVMSVSEGVNGDVAGRFQQRSKTELSKGSSIGGVLFGLPFFLAGMGILIFMSLVPATKSILAMNWERIPATVIESRMKTSHDSDGDTHKAIVKFRYRYEGMQYTSDTYDFISFISTSDRKGVQKKVDSAPRGSEQLAYVNPRKPQEAVLSVKLSWFYLFTFIFGGIFAAVGGGIIFAVTTGYRPGKTKTIKEQIQNSPMGPVVLKSRYGGPLVKFIGIFIFTVIWCGVVYLLFQKDAPGIFKGVFGISAILLVAVTGHSFLALFNPRIRLEMESSYVPLGGDVSLEWSFTGNSTKISHYSVILIGQEEATYRRGTSSYTDREPFFEKCLIENKGGVRASRGSFRVQIPQDSMYTWKASNNKIIWLLKVKGVIEKWPDIKEEYEIQVLPAAI